MKISDLISKLQNEKETCGDLDILVDVEAAKYNVHCAEITGCWVSQKDAGEQFCYITLGHDVKTYVQN